ncbi:MAG: DMT family transporter [Anaerolineae bacterium]
MPVSRSRLVAVICVAAVAISFAAIFIRFAQAEAVPALPIAAWRLTLASLVMLPYAWVGHRAEIGRFTRREMGLLAAAGTFLALHFALWIVSLEYTSVASSVVLVTTGPVFVGLGSWLLLGERPSPRLAAGIALAFAGTIIVGWVDLSRGGGHLLGDALALAGATMMASYLMVGRKVRAGHSLIAYTAPVYAIGALVLLLTTVLSGQALLGYSPAAYGWMLAMALVPQLIGHTALNWALRHLSATYVAVSTMAEPLGSGILAYVLLGEAVTLPTLLGGAVILTGIYVASRAELRGAGATEAQKALEESPGALL